MKRKREVEGTGKKLRERTGASMVLALGIMLVVSVVCVSMLKVASTAPQEAYAQQDQEQAYLAATSAAKLLKAAFNNRQKNDYEEALAILRAVEDGNGSCTLTSQLSKAGYENTQLSVLNVPITLTKAEDQKSVTAQINTATGTGYPIPLPFEVYTAEIVSETYTYNEETGEIASTESTSSGRKMYPLGYTKANAANDLLQYGDPYADNYYFQYYDYREPSETSVTPAELIVTPWQIMWRDHNNRVVKCVPLGTAAPTTEQINSAISSQSPSSYTETYDNETTIYDFDSWKSYTTEADALTYTITGNYTPYQKWQVIWQNYDGTTRHSVYLKDKIEETNLATLAEVLPGYDENNSSIQPMQENPKYIYSYTGWNWAGRISDTTARTITVSPSYTTETRHRMIWQNADGSTLQSKDYGNTAPADPDVPSKDSNSTYFHYVGSWGTGVESADENGVPVITKKPVYRIIADKEYTIVWLNDAGNAADTLETKFSTAGQAEPTTDKIPVRTDAEKFFPFTGWDDGVMNEGTYTKTYTPIFSDVGQTLHTVIWKGPNDSVLKRVDYGDVAPDLTAPVAPATYAPDDKTYYHYNYTGWSDTVVGNTTTHTAVYDTAHPVVDKSYTIRWMNGSYMEWDNSANGDINHTNNTLCVKQAIEETVEPFVDGTPIHSDANNFYEFVGWDQGKMSGTEEGETPVKTYTPQFRDTGTPKYTVIWYNDTLGDTIFDKTYFATADAARSASLSSHPTKAGYTTSWGSVTANATNDHLYECRPNFTANAGVEEGTDSGDGADL